MFQNLVILRSKNWAWYTVKVHSFTSGQLNSIFGTIFVQKYLFCIKNPSCEGTQESHFFGWFLCYFWTSKKSMSHKMRMYCDKWLFFVKTHPKWPKDMTQVQKNGFENNWNLAKMSSSRATVPRPLLSSIPYIHSRSFGSSSNMICRKNGNDIVQNRNFNRLICIFKCLGSK